MVHRFGAYLKRIQWKELYFFCILVSMIIQNRRSHDTMVTNMSSPVSSVASILYTPMHTFFSAVF